MRLSTVLLQCCALLHCAAAKDAYLYAFDDERGSPSTIPSTISANTAFVIASRRQGVADALRLDGVDEKALLQIAENGGYQQPLFSEATNTVLARVLVRIQADKPEALQLAHKQASFQVKNPTKDILYLETRRSDVRNHTYGFVSKEGVRFTCLVDDETPILSDKKNLSVSKSADILDLISSYLIETKDIVSATVDVDFTSSKLSHTSISTQINMLIDHLQSAVSTSKIQPTLFILPQTSQLVSSTIFIAKRQDVEEELLDLTIPSTPSALLEDPTAYKKKNTTTLPRRFPTCFSSKESCINGTNSCSGHGSCQASGSSKNCFQCKCVRTTIRTNEDGSKKTTLWAGAACQKKDISVEFTLFVVFGVTMFALIAGVIGMMYGMGAQELPSVIGAGVAGPSARK